MARPLRLEFAGALYHVTARGNERDDIFLGGGDDDRVAFLDTIPHRQRRCVAKPLSYFAANFTERDLAITAAYRIGAYSMQVIADYFGVGRMTISRAVKQFETGSKTNVQWDV